MKRKNYAAAALALPLIGASAAAAQELGGPETSPVALADPSSPSVDAIKIPQPAAGRDSGVLAESASAVRAIQVSGDDALGAPADDPADEEDAETAPIAPVAESGTTIEVPPTTKAPTTTEAPPTTKAQAPEAAAVEAPAEQSNQKNEQTAVPADVPVDVPVDVAVDVADPDAAAYDAYRNAGYSYTQLLLLTEEWGVGKFEAKARAGRAILAGDRSQIDNLIEDLAATNDDDMQAWEERLAENPNYAEEQAFPEVTNEMQVAFSQYWAAGYSYSQLLVLADEWGVKEWEAKFRAGKAIQAGNQAEIDAVLAGG